MVIKLTQKVAQTITVERGRGQKGEDGHTPIKGVDYFDGIATYDYAVLNGYNGTEEDFNTRLSEIDKLANVPSDTITELAQITTINVKNFGAKGDGVTDDTLAIQSAIDSLSQTGGGRIFFPIGTYKITSAINISKKFIIIDGEGKKSTIYNTGTTSSIIFQDSDQIVIKNIGIDGIGGIAGVNAINLHGIEFINTHHVKLDNVSIMYNGGHGIYLHGGAWCYSIIACNITQNKLDGINSVSPSGASNNQNGNNMSVINTSLLQNGGNGISWKASGLNISGCGIELNQLSGILIDTQSSTLSAYGISIVGNYFEMNRQGQIKLNTISGYVIKGLLISGNTIYSAYEGGSSSLIFGTGVDDSLYNLEIGESNRYEVGGSTVTKYIDLNNMPSIYSKISVRDLTVIANLGRAEVDLPIKNMVLSGLFNQKGYAFTVPNKSDNIYSMTPKVGYYELPLKEGDYIYKVRCFVESNCTDNYVVTFTLQNADVSGANSLSTVSLSVINAIGGGNKLAEWVVFGSVNYRHVKNKNLYLKIDITNPTTGSTMYLRDLVLEYI
jgi:hypothetical protein